MFEFLFKYPASAFAKGDVVLLGRWPVWLLAVILVLGGAVLGWQIWRTRASHAPGISGLKPVGIWLLQTLLLALLILMLWQPALSIATLRPQQNIVAVIVDDSGSMAIADNGKTRLDEARQVLNSGVLKDLEKKFQVRLYRAGAALERITSIDSLTPSETATRLGESLKQVVAESSSLPIGAVVLLSDGAENAGGIDLPTLSEIRRQKIPVHTIGFGREKLAHDIEITDVQVPARTLADARLSALVTFHQNGYAGRHAKLQVKDGNKVLAVQDVTLKDDGTEQSEAIVFNAGPPGARGVQVSLEPQEGEENLNNNSLMRLVGVEASKPRVLYIEGEPKWEYKFIRRAVDQDRTLLMSSMLRTTQNKIYRQGIATPTELEDGFPAKVEELFAYQGLIIGGVEAGYFTPNQQELIRQFVDRRGGGILFLGGRGGLADGGVGGSPLADLLPVTLPNRQNTFRRDPANVELTAAGRDSLLCRIEENPERNVDRWKKLPYLANYQEVGTPKPGAVVLAEMNPGNTRKMPLLVTQNYGRGRVALFATAGSWRWQMTQPLQDQSHEMFWQQMLRWVVAGTAERVIASTPKTVFSDETRIHLRAEVRDKTYLPMSDAKVEARILGPGNLAESVELHPDPATEGVFEADWAAQGPGAYVAEILAKHGEEDAGRDVITFRREDGVAEKFHVQQNRELLEKLSSQTGGRYYKPADVRNLADEISYSEAGITTRETRDLWDMPIVFLLALLFRSGEWLLRRKWGVV
ncbi:MAG TPA: glutamine amidotransferase [Bryobacteraceae bacterium]|nr:glutamine amidotransferase [Bryobacteraceae bacterium]